MSKTHTAPIQCQTVEINKEEIQLSNPNNLCIIMHVTGSVYVHAILGFFFGSVKDRYSVLFYFE